MSNIPGFMKKFTVGLLLSLVSASAFANTKMANPTPSQKQAIHSAISKSDNPTINLAINEARKNIETLALSASCNSDYELIGIGAILSSHATNRTNLWSPISGMQYAPRNQCLTVMRIGGWAMPAKNTLSFTIVYQSDVSDENKISQVEMQKEGGVWLVVSHL